MKVTKSAIEMPLSESTFTWKQLDKFRLHETKRNKWLTMKWDLGEGKMYHCAFGSDDFLKFYEYLKKHFPNKEHKHWYE